MVNSAMTAGTSASRRSSCVALHGSGIDREGGVDREFEIVGYPSIRGPAVGSLELLGLERTDVGLDLLLCGAGLFDEEVGGTGSSHPG